MSYEHIAAGISLLLEANDNVVSKAHEDHVARGFTPSPALDPEIEHIVEMDIGEQR